MAIKRACSYTATIKTPVVPSEYTAILVTFSQNGTNLIEKDETQVTLTDDAIVVNLDQTETKQFTACAKAFLQVRCFKSQYDAPGSAIWAIPVWPALNDEVLS